MKLTQIHAEDLEYGDILHHESETGQVTSLGRSLIGGEIVVELNEEESRTLFFGPKELVRIEG